MANNAAGWSRVDGKMAAGGESVANSGNLAASQPNPVWVKFDPESDAAYIGLEVIGPGEAVQQVIVEGVPNSADIVLDFNSSGQLLGVEVIGARAVLSDQLLAFGGQ